MQRPDLKQEYKTMFPTEPVHSFGVGALIKLLSRLFHHLGTGIRMGADGEDLDSVDNPRVQPWSRCETYSFHEVTPYRISVVLSGSAMRRSGAWLVEKPLYGPVP